MTWLSWQALCLLITANSAPVVAAWCLRKRCTWPIDGGLVLPDGGRLFGAHKTWRGLVAAAVATAGIGRLLGVPWWLGAGAGVATIAGDLLSSFTKRRLRLRDGAWIPGLDQLPEAALPLLVLWEPLDLDWSSALGTIAAFALLDLAASRLVGSSRTRRPTGDDREPVP